MPSGIQIGAIRNYLARPGVTNHITNRKRIRYQAVKKIQNKQRVYQDLMSLLLSLQCLQLQRCSIGNANVILRTVVIHVRYKENQNKQSLFPSSQVSDLGEIQIILMGASNERGQRRSKIHHLGGVRDSQ